VEDFQNNNNNTVNTYNIRQEIYKNILNKKLIDNKKDFIQLGENDNLNLENKIRNNNITEIIKVKGKKINYNFFKLLKILYNSINQLLLFNLKI